MAGKVQVALDAIAKIEGLRTEAITELLAERGHIDEQLRSLGYSADLSKQKRPKRIIDPNTACPICTFVTAPVHDARKHRGQGKKKHAFTTEELKELGLTKVAKTASA